MQLRSVVAKPESRAQVDRTILQPAQECTASHDQDEDVSSCIGGTPAMYSLEAFHSPRELTSNEMKSYKPQLDVTVDVTVVIASTATWLGACQCHQGHRVTRQVQIASIPVQVLAVCSSGQAEGWYECWRCLWCFVDMDWLSETAPAHILVPWTETVATAILPRISPPRALSLLSLCHSLLR